MKVQEKNEGKKISYTVNGTKISLDDMLTIDLKRYQKTEEHIVDISLDQNDVLQMGLGCWYVANIILPPKEYDDVEEEIPEGQYSGMSGTEESKTRIVRVEKPLNMDNVTLVLWALPINYISGGAY